MGTEVRYTLYILGTRGYYIHIYRALFLGILLLSFPAVGLIMYYINLRSTACIMSGLIRRMVSNAYNLVRAHRRLGFRRLRYCYPRDMCRLFARSPEHAQPSKLDLHLSCSSGWDEIYSDNCYNILKFWY